MNRDEYEARRQATSELARRVPATLDNEMAIQIRDELRAEGIAQTPQGYVRAWDLLAERAPELSPLQRNTIAEHIASRRTP